MVLITAWRGLRLLVVLGACYLTTRTDGSRRFAAPIAPPARAAD